MPVNKAAAHRHRILDECLRNPMRVWTRKSLLETLNDRLDEDGIGTISESQLRNDMSAMQSEYGAPLEEYKEGKSICYRYEDPTFSILNLPLEETDIARLRDAATLLQGIRGFAQMADIADVLSRLESRLHLGAGPQRAILAFDQAPELKGLDFLEDLYLAIRGQHVLRIKYRKFGQAASSEYILHPYFLKQYNHRWYVLGHDPEKPYLLCLALDRMEAVKVVNMPYVPNDRLDPETYFNNVIGVTIYEGAVAEEVLLKFSAPIAQYVLTKPIHQTQRVVRHEPDGCVTVMLRVIINPELESTVLSYGASVEVLAPQVLRKSIADKAAATAKIYEAAKA